MERNLPDRLELGQDPRDHLARVRCEAERKKTHTHSRPLFLYFRDFNTAAFGIGDSRFESTTIF